MERAREMESHYDLGLEYKEMEPYEDAIDAFRAALPSAHSQNRLIRYDAKGTARLAR